MAARPMPFHEDFDIFAAEFWEPDRAGRDRIRIEIRLYNRPVDQRKPVSWSISTQVKHLSYPLRRARSQSKRRSRSWSWCVILLPRNKRDDTLNRISSAITRVRSSVDPVHGSPSERSSRNCSSRDDDAVTEPAIYIHSGWSLCTINGRTDARRNYRAIAIIVLPCWNANSFCRFVLSKSPVYVTATMLRASQWEDLWREGRSAGIICLGSTRWNRDSFSYREELL